MRHVCNHENNSRSNLLMSKRFSILTVVPEGTVQHTVTLDREIPYNGDFQFRLDIGYVKSHIKVDEFY